MKIPKPNKRKKLPSIKSLKAKSWKLMSLNRRLFYTDDNGYGPCVTCGVVKHYKELHAGHFIHASKGSLVSYDNRNIHLQCRQCNFFNPSGMVPINYTLFIQENYGTETIDELKQLKQTIMKRKDFEEVIERLEGEAT